MEILRVRGYSGRLLPAHKLLQIIRAAGFGANARVEEATKRLLSHNRCSTLSIDIEIP